VRIACPHADRCAGCPAIDEPYGAQLRVKERRVDRAIARFGSLGSVERREAHPAPTLAEYRTRAKLVVEGGAIGLYAKGLDHVVVDIPECRVIGPSMRRATDALRAAVRSNARLRRALLAVDLREARDERGRSSLIVTLVLDELTEPPDPRWVRDLRERLPEVAILATSRRARRSPMLLGRAPEVVSGPAELDDVVEVAGRRVSVPAVPGGFVQAHREQAARLRGRLVELLGEASIALRGARVVDAYAGSGALGIALASSGARVLLVESFAPAIERALDAAKRQDIDLHATAGDAAEVLSSLARRGRTADVVVLNPPRRGVSPAVRSAAASLATKAIGYVSCEPDTLARDLDHFAELGWRARTLEPFDMIPLTREVETLALLTPGPGREPRVVHREVGLVAVDKPPHLPTTPHPECLHSLLERVRGLPGLAEAVPVHRLDEGTSGLALIATHPSHVEAWSGALAEGHKTYVALARGITRPKGVVARALRIDGREVEARTRYRRIAVVGGHSLLRVSPETGRTHQIRRHLAGLGHPLLGDERYGHAASNRHFEEQLGLDRTFLHLERIALRSADGALIELHAPLPGDLRTVLDRLGGEGLSFE
jgi:23S rRNA (uracil1939-C5)-methyltransferase